MVTSKQLKISGWSCVIGGFAIHLVLGTLYIWANITSAVTSYLRRYDPSVTYLRYDSDSLSIYSASLAAQGATMFLGGLLVKSIYIIVRLNITFSCLCNFECISLIIMIDAGEQ